MSNMEMKSQIIINAKNVEYQKKYLKNRINDYNFSKIHLIMLVYNIKKRKNIIEF